MGKANDPYAGLHLADQAPSETKRLDQRLFTSSLPSAPISPVHSDPPSEEISSPATVNSRPSNQETKEPWNQGRKVPTNQGTKEPSNQETLEPSKVQTKQPRKAGKRPGPSSRFDLRITPDRPNTYSFTEAELWAIEDVQQSLQRNHGIEATKYDIVRCGVHLVVEDFLQLGNQSQVAQRIRRRRSR